MFFEKQLDTYAVMVEIALEKLFPQANGPQSRLIEAVNYSLLGGGKRLRPALLLEFFGLGGRDVQMAMPFACAVEMIHTYSLIHDDLPCMDDDDFRRGRPSCHKAYGQATALLAGDMLLNSAFELMSAAKLPEARAVLSTASYVSRSSGISGMIGGQAADLHFEKQGNVSPEEHELMVMGKTVALFKAACAGGCILSGAERDLVQAAEGFATAVGVAFQITDDVLDVCGDAEQLGKPIGSDAQAGKVTYVSIYGLEGARAMARQRLDEAKAHLGRIPYSRFLADMCDWMETRVR